MAEKYDAKFTNKYPLRGIGKRPIPANSPSRDVAAAYTQLTKIGKVSSDATVKDVEGNYVPFTTSMYDVLPEVKKGFEEKKEEAVDPPVVDPDPTPDPKPEVDPEAPVE